MKKQFTFLLLAAALLVSVPSWAQYAPEKESRRSFTYYKLPKVGSFSKTSNTFGTICVPERIVAIQGIEIYDVYCVDVDPSDTTQVARLVVAVHRKCSHDGQGIYFGATASDEPWCPYSYQNPEPKEGKSYIDWTTGEIFDDKASQAAGFDVYWYEDHRMVAGAAYFYVAHASELEDRLVWVDSTDVADAPVCQNGFYGTFKNTYLADPIVVLSQDANGYQYLEKAKQVTMPANRGYFKGNFECVPWRWNTSSPNFTAEFQAKWGVTTAINPRHNPCTGEIYEDSHSAEAPSRVMFNVGPRDAATGLYSVDLEHPIYFESNKRIENGQLIIEAADGTKYNAFGQRVQ